MGPLLVIHGVKIPINGLINAYPGVVYPYLSEAIALLITGKGPPFGRVFLELFSGIRLPANPRYNSLKLTALLGIRSFYFQGANWPTAVSFLLANLAVKGSWIPIE